MPRRNVVNPNNKDMDKFNRAMETGRAQLVPVWRRGERMRVRAMGHLHPDQFTHLVAPTEYVHDWDYLAHEENNPIFDKNPQLREAQKRFVGNVEYNVDDLVKSVREHGVSTPVIISKHQKDTAMVDIEKNDWERDEQGGIIFRPKHALIDGHHRAYAAMRTNQLIPVYIADEEQIRLR